MAECADGVYLVDVGVRRSGYAVITIGLGLFVIAVAIVVMTRHDALAMLPIGAAVTAVGGGVHLLRVPSSGAKLVIDESGVTLWRGTCSIRLGWSDISSWGVANRHAFGANSRFTQLLVWPSERVSEETKRHARPLWRSDRGAWALTVYDPDPDLVAYLERYAPPPRRDVLVDPDW